VGRGVLVDMDGLLLDTERIAEKAWTRAEKEVGITLPEGYYFSLIGQSMRIIGERLEELLPADRVQPYLAAANRIYHKLLFQEPLPVKPGARIFLEALHASGPNYCLATSTFRKLALDKLERAGLSDLMPQRVCGDDVVASKPEPDIYLAAARKIGISPEACFAVEDSPNGIRAALAAGCRVIHVPDLAPVPPELLASCVYVGNDLNEVVEVLNSADSGLAIDLKA